MNLIGFISNENLLEAQYAARKCNIDDFGPVASGDNSVLLGAT